MKQGQKFINKKNKEIELTIREVDETNYAFVDITNITVIGYLGEVSTGTLSTHILKSEIETDYNPI
jgi:hypothetical protein